MNVKRELSADGKQLVIFLNDKFDFRNVQDFREAYMNSVENVEQVVVDLRATEYMDSSALGMLLNMRKVMAAQVNEFKIVNCREQITKVLKISRFDKKFDIES